VTSDSEVSREKSMQRNAISWMNGLLVVVLLGSVAAVKMLRIPTPLERNELAVTRVVESTALLLQRERDMFRVAQERHAAHPTEWAAAFQLAYRMWTVRNYQERLQENVGAALEDQVEIQHAAIEQLADRAGRLAATPYQRQMSDALIQRLRNDRKLKAVPGTRA
jgi:hypothetical protein